MEDYILFSLVFLIEYIYHACSLLKLIFIGRILNKKFKNPFFSLKILINDAN